MSARKIHGSWWVDFRNERKRHRIRSPENSKIGAQAYEGLLRQRLAKGEPIIQQNIVLPTFAVFSQQWYETYVCNNNKPSEQRNKRLALKRHLLPWFGHLCLSHITVQQIEEFKSAKLQVGLAPKTINNMLAMLGKCLHVAQEWLDLPKVPKIKLLKVPPQRFDFLSPTESSHLLKSVNDPFWHTMILFALKTGLRLGELMGLDWNDINLRTRMVTVRRSIVRGIIGSPKSNRARYIPLTSDLCKILDLWEQPKTGWVFSLNGTRPQNRKTPQEALTRLCKTAEMRKVGWHTFRHTFASQLVANGASLKAVQELLGHSDIVTTMRYAHLAPSALRQAIDTLDEVNNSEITNFGQPVGNNAFLPVSL